MMATIVSNLCFFFTARGRTPIDSIFRRRTHVIFPPFSSKFRASSVVIGEREANIGISRNSSGLGVLACPICYEPLLQTCYSDRKEQSTIGTNFHCHTCKRMYSNNDIYVDLAISSVATEYDESLPFSTEIFRSPLVSFLYERGWRQSFAWGGFPGPEREFEMAKEYLKFTLGGTIVDLSCGSGLFSRLFAKSDLYSLVVALDFSENMLKQCDEFIRQENISKEKLILVRADVSRLPFASSSIDAIHAGAALHCWPTPAGAVAEISRVLKPGGIFVATTAIFDGIFELIPFRRLIREVVVNTTSNRFYLSEKELEGICAACGLVDLTRSRNGPFVMICAKKPS